ncbi:MAG: hypothetical protein GXY83_12455 [Rhodopirellula sp.]|nr:hypothetical protein [Rhodopirellula sp.]
MSKKKVPKPYPTSREGEVRELNLKYDRNLAYVRFHPDLWRQLGPEDLHKVRQAAKESIARYYERIG